MIKLIKNEFKKIFKRKTIWILLSLLLVFILFCFFMDKKYSTQNYDNYSYMYDESNIKYFEEELEKTDSKKESDTETYLYLRTQLDQISLGQKYEINSWQRYIISSRLYGVIYEMNMNKYINNNEEKYNESKEEYDKYIEAFEKNDWTIFTKERITELEQEIKSNETVLNTLVDKKQINDLKRQIESLKNELEVNNIRLKENISYGTDYLNSALDSILASKNNITEYNYTTVHQKYDEQNLAVSKEILAKKTYSIENRVDLDTVNLRSEVLSINESLLLFLIVVVVVIGGTIVSEEFNKGTMKLLLVKPYPRYKILLSKFIAMFGVMFIFIGAIYLFELISGGIIFGFDSLSVPALYYNYNTNLLVSMNPIMGSLLNLACSLPQVILLGTLAFALGTIFNISALSVALPLGGVFAAELINTVALMKNIKFLKYFVTLNWDFNAYLFGGMSEFKFTNFPFSLIVCIIYFLIMVITMFIVFKKKNIKNI